MEGDHVKSVSQLNHLPWRFMGTESKNSIAKWCEIHDVQFFLLDGSCHRASMDSVFHLGRKFEKIWCALTELRGLSDEETFVWPGVSINGGIQKCLVCTGMSPQKWMIYPHFRKSISMIFNHINTIQHRFIFSWRRLASPKILFLPTCVADPGGLSSIFGYLNDLAQFQSSVPYFSTPMTSFGLIILYYHILFYSYARIHFAHNC